MMPAVQCGAASFVNGLTTRRRLDPSGISVARCVISKHTLLESDQTPTQYRTGPLAGGLTFQSVEAVWEQVLQGVVPGLWATLADQQRASRAVVPEAVTLAVARAQVRPVPGAVARVARTWRTVPGTSEPVEPLPYAPARGRTLPPPIPRRQR